MIALVTTGGTIASVALADGRPAAALAGRAIVDGIPGADRFGDIEVVEVARVNGWNMTPDLAMTAIDQVCASIDQGATGVVVTHGTDSLQETAFLLDVHAGHLTSKAPIVVTGAMRTADELGADGQRNLFDALSVVSSPSARGHGCLVVMHEEIHLGRRVHKARSTGLRPFESWPGPVGRLVAGSVVFDVPPAGDGPRGARALAGPVPIVMAWTGDDAALLRHVVSTGARGVVVVGTGAGNAPGAYGDAIAEAVAQGVAVVVTTRCAGGTAPIYGGPGALATLVEAGAIDAGRLPPATARLALMSALAACDSRQAIADWIASL